MPHHRHVLRLHTAGGTSRVVAVRAPADVAILSLEITSGENPIFFERFGRWAAVCLPDGEIWPDPVECIVECNRADSVHQVFVRDCPGNPQHHGATDLPWHRLQAIEQSALRNAPDAETQLGASLFYSLDLDSHPDLMRERRPMCTGGNESEEHITAAMNAINARLGERQQGADNPQPLADEIIMMFALPFQSMLRESVGSDAPASVRARLLKTCGAFGAGAWALRLGLNQPDRMGARYIGESLRRRFSNGSPNGAFVFAFAELALAALDAAPHNSFIDAMLWEAALPGLVRAAENYLLCYAPRDEAGHVCCFAYDYPSIHTDRSVPDRGLNQDALQELDRQYATMDVHNAKTRLRLMLQSAFGPITPPQQPSVVHQFNAELIAPSAMIGYFPSIQPEPVARQAWWS